MAKSFSIEDLNKEMNKVNPLKFDVIEKFVLETEEEEEQVASIENNEVEDNLNIIKRYIDSLVTDLDKEKLYSEMHEIYIEAQIKDAASLPATMTNYINFINSEIGAPVKYVSNGPGRDQIVHV